MNWHLLDENSIHHFVASWILEENISDLERTRGVDWDLNEYVHAARHSRYLIPLSIAISHERFKVLEYLLSFKDLDLNFTEQPALPLAATHMSVDWIGRFIDCGADINAFNRVRNTAFDIAMRQGRVDIAQYLVNVGFKISGDQYKCLRSTVYFQQDRELVKKLIEWGLDVSSGPTDKVFSGAPSALQLAVRKNDEIMVNLLLDAGADVQVTDEYGVTPRMEAEKHGFTELGKRLAALERRKVDSDEVRESLLSVGVDVDLLDFLSSDNRTIEFDCDGERARLNFYHLTDVPQLEHFGIRYLWLTSESENALYCGPLVWLLEEARLGHIDLEHEEAYRSLDWKGFLADPGRAIADMEHILSGR